MGAPSSIRGLQVKAKDGQLNLTKRKKGGVEDIYQAISDAIKSTLGEFDLLESNNSGNQGDPNEIIPELKKSALNFQIEDFLNPMRGSKSNQQQTSSQSSLQKLLLNSAMMLGSTNKCKEA